MGDLLRDALQEIAAAPARYLAELVQFGVLVGLIWWIGRGKLRHRLESRRDRVAAQLGEAEQAVAEAGRMREEAAALEERRGRQAATLLETADTEATKRREAALAAMEVEAGEIVAQARVVVEREKERIARESATRLVRLTAEAARRYLDEILTEGERRALTQRAILASLEQLEGGVPSGQGAGRDAGG